MTQRIAQQWFTLIELLVVISIIALLASLLLPSLQKAKQRLQITVCQNNQKQAYLALQMYGSDMEEYPTNYEGSMPTSWNWGDECSGRWNGGPPAQVSWSYNTAPFYYPAQNSGAVDLLLNAKYATKAFLACSVSLKGEATSGNGGWYFASRTWDNYQTGTYQYNGPHAGGNNLLNNAAMSGLALLSRANWNSPATDTNWGVRYKSDIIRRPTVKYTTSQIPLLACPSIVRNDGEYREPHNPGSSLSMPYNVQFDYTNQGWLARNYVFGDGHVSFVYATTRSGYKPD